MEPTQELIDDIYAEKVQRARRGTFEQKFLAGGELFDAAIERMKMGVLVQMPRASEEEITAEILRRLKIGRMMENRD